MTGEVLFWCWEWAWGMLWASPGGAVVQELSRALPCAGMVAMPCTLCMSMAAGDGARGQMQLGCAAFLGCVWALSAASGHAVSGQLEHGLLGTPFKGQ